MRSEDASALALHLFRSEKLSATMGGLQKPILRLQQDHTLWVSIFSTASSETFLVLRRTERDINKYITYIGYWSPYEVPIIGLRMKYQLLVSVWSANYWSPYEIPIIGLRMKYQLLVSVWSTNYWSPYKVPQLFLSDFNKTEIFSAYFSKILKYRISRKSFQMEPRCSMRTDRQTDRHDECNSRFWQFPYSS
jgi:hypothetical protein